jgi:hypothetical protein
MGQFSSYSHETHCNAHFPKVQIDQPINLTRTRYTGVPTEKVSKLRSARLTCSTARKHTTCLPFHISIDSISKKQRTLAQKFGTAQAISEQFHCE